MINLGLILVVLLVIKLPLCLFLYGLPSHRYDHDGGDAS